jgi:hypothetical protein
MLTELSIVCEEIDRTFNTFQRTIIPMFLIILVKEKLL